ncbi:MAG TPA: D-alanyl-D-alanine carboxypeptidase/D-alanyl-D-alanine-endopeptidase [Pyrinomonadaceae bacterium]
MPSRKNHAHARPTPFISRFLIIALLACATPSQPLAAQSRQRDRRVNTQRPAPTPTPTTKQTPTPTPLAVPTPAPSDTPLDKDTAPAPQPSPTPTPAARQTAPAPQTLEELRARIREITSRPAFASSQLALKIVSLETGRVIYEENAHKWMQPASNMKLYTVAAALDRFGPDYRFVTSVYAPARPDRAGLIKGDLTVYGRGDPTYATRFNPEDEEKNYYRAIDELAARVVAAGVRKIEGDLVGDESYFAGIALAPGWEWDDLQWWYGAEVSALTVNDNSVDLAVKPGARVGDPCFITTGPPTSLVTVIDRTRTSARGTTRELVVHRPLGQNSIEVSGTMPIDDRGFTASVAVSRPAMMFAAMLRASLERHGVVVTGKTRTIDARGRADSATPLEVSALVELATRQSPPLSIIAAQTMKPSQNLYTELLLRALGKREATDPKKTSEESGVAAVRSLLTKAGIDAGRLLIIDGSGLSRGNLVTAEATLQLLVYMNGHPHAHFFRDALPVAGVDGTLRNRMRNTAATGNVRAKTGTLGSATSLSGYLFTAAGERLAFSLMINNPPRDTDPRAGFTDAVAVLLASFTGRS